MSGCWWQWLLVLFLLRSLAWRRLDSSHHGVDGSTACGTLVTPRSTFRLSLQSANISPPPGCVFLDSYIALEKILSGIIFLSNNKIYVSFFTSRVFSRLHSSLICTFSSACFLSVPTTVSSRSTMFASLLFCTPSLPRTSLVWWFDLCWPWRRLFAFWPALRSPKLWMSTLLDSIPLQKSEPPRRKKPRKLPGRNQWRTKACSTRPVKPPRRRIRFIQR